MRARSGLALLAVCVLALGFAVRRQASRTDSDSLDAATQTEAQSSSSVLAPPKEASEPERREVLGAARDELLADSPAPPLENAADAPPEPLTVTARLTHPVAGLGDDEFMLYAVDPAQPLVPYAGVPMRLDRATAIPIPAGVEFVDLQLTGGQLILDPQPRVRNPAGKQLELTLDVSGSLVVRVLEPWLDAPDLMVYAAESDRRDIWREVMEGRGKAPDARGECRFDDLRPGYYLVQVENSATKEAGALKRMVRVPAGATASLELGGPDPAALVLEGIVRRGTRPLVGAEVSAGSFERVYGAKSVTDDSGRFELSLPGPGRYEFRVGGHTEFRDVDVLGTTQEFVLPDESLCVVVVDAAGDPVPGVIVSLATLIEQGADPGARETRVAVTMNTGSLCFDGLRAGRYAVMIGDDVMFRGEGEQFPPQRIEVEVPTRGPVRIVLQEPNALVGIVEGGSTERGIGVYLRPIAAPNSGWQWYAGTGRGGRFEASPIAAGEYELLALSLNGDSLVASRVERVQVPRAASEPLRIETHPGTRLAVEARDVDGTPLRIRLALRTDDGMLWPSDGMHSQPSNRQTSLPVPPGDYDAYGHTPDGIELHTRVTVDGSLSVQRVVLTR
ncbi:MAG: carboxypeptidase regulatory-like domain-containing protein [Planctomycetes bacterium]|nr:carboxypeptidase regulatory-like domain-containing protein [Planctomycetota bacterium]